MEIPSSSQYSIPSAIPLATTDLIVASFVVQYIIKFKSIYTRSVEQVNLLLTSAKESKTFVYHSGENISFDHISNQVRTNKWPEETFSCEVTADSSPKFHVDGMSIGDRKTNSYEIECLNYSQEMQTRFLERSSIEVPLAKRDLQLLNGLFKKQLEKIWANSFKRSFGKTVGLSFATSERHRTLKCKFMRLENDEECIKTCCDIFCRFSAECYSVQKSSAPFAIKIACKNNLGSSWELYKYEFDLTPLYYHESLTSHRHTRTSLPSEEGFDRFLQKKARIE